MKSEAKIQSEVFQKFWNKYPQYRRLFFHIPNGGKRTIVEAVRFKAMGVVPGIPDMFLSVPRGAYHGFYIELKKEGENTKVDSNQEKCQIMLRSQNYKVDTFDNYELCFEAIEDYLKLPPHKPIM